MSLWPQHRYDAEAAARLRARHAAATDPATLAAELGALLGERVEAASISTETVAQRRWRFVIYVDARSDGGPPLSLVVKGYAHQRAGPVFANHVALLAGGVDTSRAFGVSEALGAIVTERLAGRHPAGDDAAAARRCGAATARLHRSAAALEPRLELDGVLDHLDRHVAKFADGAPEHGPAALDLAAAARPLGRALGVRADEPVQGDLSRASFLLEEGRTHLIDWDAACAFDAAWDVGHYLAQLHRYELKSGQPTGAVREAYLAGYAEAAEPDAAFWRRVDYFEAVTCLHKAHALRQAGAPTWPRIVTGLLRVAAEAMARAGG